jgi:3-hydroxybutyryl-CoA dehydrogenase
MTAVVIGTGAMAPEIAVALAGAGHRVTIAGRSAERAADAAARAVALGGRAEAIAPAAIAPDAFAGAALVVETIAEDLAAKRDLLARVEPWCAPDAVIASNTSSLRIADLAVALARPARLAGLHFLKPAHLTAVVEVVAGPATDDASIDALRDVATRMGKAPLVSADVPGFIWNRIQFAVLRECLHMLEEGVADAAGIDAAVSDGLAPRWMAAGPLATADLGGLGTFAAVSRGLFPHLADGHDVPAVLTDAAASGAPLAPWTAAAGEALARLRADALAAGRAIAERRRALGA